MSRRASIGRRLRWAMARVLLTTGRDLHLGGDVASHPVAFLELTKPRITQLVLLTAAAGFYLGSRGGVDVRLLVQTLIGVALVAAGTNAFNQVRERDVDARMRRTERRPLPSGRLTPRAAALFAGVISVAGVSYLALAVNPLTAGLAALTLTSYVLLYTPLKRTTTLNTLIGAVPGALALGLACSGVSVALTRAATIARAWRVFLVSIVYLPALLTLMVVDKAVL